MGKNNENNENDINAGNKIIAESNNSNEKSTDEVEFDGKLQKYFTKSRISEFE